MAFKLNVFGYHCDYLSDRLCRLYSVIVFFVFAAYIAMELEDPKSVACWMPAYFTPDHARFSNAICRTTANFYHFYKTPDENRNPSRALRNQHMDDMYFLPILFMGQGLLFLLPWMFWRFISNCCCSLQVTVKDCNKLTSVAGLVVACSELKKVAESTVVSGIMCMAYILTKLFNGAVCLIQMGILSYFLDIDFFRYKPWVDVTYTEMNETSTRSIHMLSDLFPREIMCDFKVQQMGNVHAHSIHCAMPIHKVIENCLYVIWAWLIIVVVITAISGVIAFMKTIMWSIGINSDQFVKRKLYTNESFANADKTIRDKFVKICLKPGLRLAFDIIEENGSVLGVNSALESIWEEFVSSAKITTLDTAVGTYPTAITGHFEAPLLTRDSTVQNYPYDAAKIEDSHL